MSPEQLARFDREAAVIAARWPDVDQEFEREATAAALANYLLGDLDLDEAGEALTEARFNLDVAMAVTQTVARLAVLDGMSESQAARTAGLDRMTVRKVLGKR